MHFKQWQGHPILAYCRGLHESLISAEHNIGFCRRFTAVSKCVWNTTAFMPFYFLCFLFDANLGSLLIVTPSRLARCGIAGEQVALEGQVSKKAVMNSLAQGIQPQVSHHPSGCM